MRDIWAMTPRQMMAYVRLAKKREAKELGNGLAIAALGARGKPDAVKEEVKRLTGE